VLCVFGSIALLLAVGTYSVISYLVVQRTHEIGVRMALGAQRRDVLRLVVGHAVKLVGIGTVLGLILALLSTRALSTLLYGIGAFDAGTFAIVTVLLAGVAFLASYLPALRATRDPMSHSVIICSHELEIRFVISAVDVSAGFPSRGKQRSKAFDRLKSLTGTPKAHEWTGARAASGAMNATYHLTGSGSALVEELIMKVPVMTSVYHLDGATLRMTHFCAAQTNLG
jgi:hypothetical protein